jgi:hypothetical protein
MSDARDTSTKSSPTVTVRSAALSASTYTCGRGCGVGGWRLVLDARGAGVLGGTDGRHTSDP